VSSSEIYDFNDLTYYEILGVEKGVSPSEIRKAYRKQAQLYHPDKHGQNRRTSSSSSPTTREKKILTVEEATTRFARIAEAYEVLYDEGRRGAYDIELRNSETEKEIHQRQQEHFRQQQRQYEKYQQQQNEQQYYQKHPSETYNSFREKFSFRDPMDLFEKFFFGSGDSDDDDYEHFDDSDNSGSGAFDDLFEGFGNFFQQREKTGKHDHFSGRDGNNARPPSNVDEHTETYYDVRSNTEIYRVIRREEWHDTVGYYRVISQNFVQDVDSYSGQLRGYVPVSEPEIVDEGQMWPENGDVYGFYPGGYSTDRYTRIREKDVQLVASKYMRPGDMLFSSSGSFYAGLNSNCELLVLRDDNDIYEGKASGHDDPIVWSSDTFIRNMHQNECFLMIYGAKLAIFAGPDPEHIVGVIWESTGPTVMPSDNNMHESSPAYYLQLDNDGSLAIYQERSLDEDDNVVISVWKDLKNWLQQVIGQKKNNTKKNREKKSNVEDVRSLDLKAAWRSVCRLSASAVRHARSNEEGNECIWASGHAGCFTGLRVVLAAGGDLRKRAGKAMQKMDVMLEAFLDAIEEGADNDDDFLDTIMRMGEIVGKGVGQTAVMGWRQVQRGTRKSAQAIRARLKRELQY